MRRKEWEVKIKLGDYDFFLHNFLLLVMRLEGALDGFGQITEARERGKVSYYIFVDIDLYKAFG